MIIANSLCKKQTDKNNWILKKKRQNSHMQKLGARKS